LAITKMDALQLLGIGKKYMENISKNVEALWGEIRKLREENPIVNRVITLFGCTDTPIEVQAMHMVVWLCAENKKLKQDIVDYALKKNFSKVETDTMKNHLDIVAEIHEALFRPLSEKEAEKFEPLSEEAIALALKEGEQERDAMGQVAGSGHKPTRYTN